MWGCALAWPRSPACSPSVRPSATSSRPDASTRIARASAATRCSAATNPASCSPRPRPEPWGCRSAPSCGSSTRHASTCPRASAGRDTPSILTRPSWSSRSALPSSADATTRGHATAAVTSGARALLLLVVAAGPTAAQQRPCDPATPLGPSHDLYCIELVPAPGIMGVSGRVELAYPPGPFTVAVTPDGRSRYVPVVSLQGLPRLSSQATSAAYVAWVTPPQMDTVIKLGEVRNGSTTPRGVTMLPAEMALRPQVTPFLPVGTTPDARPSELLRLADGDTLRLEAGLVRRSLKGQTYTMYGFNGQYPGPLIEVARGSEVVVAFTNRLPESTTVHWHGIRLDNRFDGTPDLTQPAVPPGGAFVYRGRVPDAGVYWYHPHVREDIQQELGLYGNVLVRSPDGAAYGPANREQALMLDDLLVGPSGPIPLGRESPTHALMGRFGNLFLVNGEPDYRLAARHGEVIRFFLTNASSTRTMNISFPGARMKVVASDAGPFERETWVESVVIAPAERYIVHVRFDRPGRVALVNRVEGLDHLFGRFLPEVDTLGIVEVAAERVGHDLAASFAALRRDTTTTRELEPYRQFLQRPTDKSLILTLETRGLPPVTQRLMQLDSIYFAPVEWSGTMPMMNWASTGRQVRWILRDPATGRENMDIDWRFRRGEPVKLRLVNERLSFHGMQHPIHLHGQRFLVLAVNGVPNDDFAWKDTVLVPAGSVVDIVLDPSNPGRWMLHCHIAEHLAAGMMMTFTVE